MAAKSATKTGKVSWSKAGQPEQVKHWLGTFQFVSVIWSKMNLDNFCFGKRENILQRALRKESLLDINLQWGFYALPWGYKIQIKTVSPMVKPWYLSGLLWLYSEVSKFEYDDNDDNARNKFEYYRD